MAVTLVGTGGGSAINGGNVTATFTASGLAGDVVYLAVNTPTVLAPPSGYTQIATNISGSNTLTIYRKVLTATETSVVFTGGGSASAVTAVSAFVVRGADNFVPEDIISAAATATSTNPNPPSVTTRTRGNRAIVFAGSQVNDAAVTAPTGYGNLAGASNTDTIPSSCWGAFRSTDIVTHNTVEDPATFTNWSSGAYASFTIIIRQSVSDLYWVGGTGTWSSTNAANWAQTSGGATTGYIPSGGTNVIFDSASDTGGAFTVTVSTGAACKNFSIPSGDWPMTLAGSDAWSIYGNLTFPASGFTLTYTGTATFAGSGSNTITTNGKTFFIVDFNGVGGTWTLQDALTLTGSASLTNGTLALGSFTFTCTLFSSSNANVRTIDFGTGKIVLTSATATTVWSTATITNLTTSGTQLVQHTGGGSGTKTISPGALSEANSISFTLSTTAGTVDITASSTVRNLTIANNGITLPNRAITIYGDLTIDGTSPSLNAGTSVWTFAATSGIKTITTNGDTLDFPITFNGAGGTWALGSALTVGLAAVRTITHTFGTIDLNGYNFTIFGSYTSVNNNTRRLQNTGGLGRFVLTNTNTATIWQSSITGNTTDGNVIVQTTGGGATTKSIVFNNAFLEANAISFIISNTAGTVAFDTGSCKNLTVNNNSVTVNIGVLVLYGNLTVDGTSPTITNSVASLWTFAATSGTQTINLNGNNSNTFDFPITFNGVGGTFQLQHDLNVGVSISRTVTLTNGTLDLNEFNLTLFGLFSSTSLNTRSIDFGAVSKIILTLYGATVFNTSGSSNLTISGTYPLIQVIPTISSQTSTLTFGTSVQNSINVQLSPTVTTTVVLTGTIRDLIIDNFDITLANGTRTIVGDFIVSGTTPTLNSGTSVTTLRSESTSIINLNGNNSNRLDFPITIENGIRQLTHNLNIGISTSRAVTLGGSPATAAVLDLNEYTLNVYGAVLGTDDSLARELDFGTAGKIQLSLAGASATTIWNVATRNMTISGNSLVEVIGAGTLVRTITGIVPGTGTGELGSVNISVLTSAGTATITGELKNLTLNCAGTTITNSTRKLYGNFNFVSATLSAGTLVTTFAATSGTKTITTNANTIVFPITFDGVGGTWQLQDALTMDSARLITLTSGTFSLNGYTCTAAGGFAVTGINTKVLAHGTSDLVISLAGATAFNATGTNLTSTGIGKINMTSASAKTFIGNGNSYATLNQGGAGTLTITGSNSFQNITNSTQPATVLFTAGTTQTFTSDFNLNGTSGNLITIGSVTPASTFTLSKSSGIIGVSFCTISDSIATGGADWNAYTSNGNVNGGNNTGWLFVALVTATAQFLQFFF